MIGTNSQIDLPEPSPDLTRFRNRLSAGRLSFQRCDECHDAWLPPRDHCPHCLSPAFTWEDASGRARVVSWVVYHRAFHPAFADRVPYNVTVVELAEGPRLISNVVGISAADGLAIDTPLALAVETEGDVPVARFRLS
ncbi:Zn-ribbon domain-containing OB-fold protein [Conexibacter sp. DBS9H8]|uniref:Zn-ribbon domain-containing OB-fold protein n=1 Tax=Conexibacter sp. DBS9H8 TaxID=2937801 RepID=UPI002111B7B3|nr:OB-fold domain-containing protein [Conexibacter sp. DBS9H8]